MGSMSVSDYEYHDEKTSRKPLQKLHFSTGSPIRIALGASDSTKLFSATASKNYYYNIVAIGVARR